MDVAMGIINNVVADGPAMDVQRSMQHGVDYWPKYLSRCCRGQPVGEGVHVLSMQNLQKWQLIL